MVKNFLAWLAKRPDRWAHLRHTTPRQLASMLTAVFLLFSVLGFYNDLMDGSTEPYLLVLLNAAFGGSLAVLWLVVLTRLPRYWLLLVLGVQILSGPIFHFMARGVRHAFQANNVNATSGIHFAAISIFACVMSSYSFFVYYIRSTGRDASRLRTELELAHAIQKTLVPVISQCTARYEIYGISQPSEKVGGDLVDALALPNGDLIAYVADIAGHGLPAGILMGMLKTATRTALRDQGAGDGAMSLSRLMERLDLVLPEVKESHMYATFTALRLNADGECFYGMAGSPPMLHLHSAEKKITRLDEEQFPLGLLPVGAFPARHLLLCPGDVLLIATDGVIEVASKNDVEFGVGGVERLLAREAHRPLAEVSACLLDAVRGHGRQHDDQTLLLVRRL